MTNADLTAFIVAQLDKAERDAKQVEEYGGCCSGCACGCLDHGEAKHEVEAKRLLLHAHSQRHECISLLDHGERSAVDGQPWEYWEPKDTAEHGPCLVLRCLALPYADREGFREEWRP